MTKRIYGSGFRALLGCSLLLAGLTQKPAQAQTQTTAASLSPGAVFAATNGVNRNEIVMYKRLKNGRLQWIGKFDTGGRGEGGINDPLQSQNSLVLTPDHAFLLAVNAGSSTISVFRVLDDGLVLVDVQPSLGGNPVSIALHDDLVYVVNFGGIYHTAGFRMKPWGELTPIRNSRMPLSTLDTNPSTAAFSADGSQLIVSERQTNIVDVFTVASDGSLSNIVSNKFTSTEPFGLQVDPSGVLLVTSTAGSLTSYNVNEDNTLSVITANSPTSGGATCWVVNYGGQAWVTNTTTSTLSAFTLKPGGVLVPLGVVATQSPTGPTLFPPVKPPTSFPLDLALSSDGNYLYAVFSALGQIVEYKTGDNGKLTEIGAVSPYPAQTGVEGLAAY